MQSADWSHSDGRKMSGNNFSFYFSILLKFTFLRLLILYASIFNYFSLLFFSLAHHLRNVKCDSLV